MAAGSFKGRPLVASVAGTLAMGACLLCLSSFFLNRRIKALEGVVAPQLLHLAPPPPPPSSSSLLFADPLSGMRDVSMEPTALAPPPPPLSRRAEEVTTAHASALNTTKKAATAARPATTRAPQAKRAPVTTRAPATTRAPQTTRPPATTRPPVPAPKAKATTIAPVRAANAKPAASAGTGPAGAKAAKTAAAAAAGGGRGGGGAPAAAASTTTLPPATRAIAAASDAAGGSLAPQRGGGGGGSSLALHKSAKKWLDACVEKCPIERVLPSSEYWSHRRHFLFYKRLYCAIHRYAPTAASALDVGSALPPFINALTWVPSRSIVGPKFAGNVGKGGVEMYTIPRIREKFNVSAYQADFLEWAPPAGREKYDLVLCSEVIEHISKPRAFMQKLLGTAKTAVISVPYRWANCDHVNCHHKQNEITRDKIAAWAGRQPEAYDIVEEENGDKRIICVYRT